MKLLMAWTDSHGLDHEEEFICTGDIDFEFCDYKLWKLVQDEGFTVSLCKVDDEK